MRYIADPSVAERMRAPKPKKPRSRLHEFASEIYRDPRFEELTKEIEGDFYHAWRQAGGPEEREKVWEELQAFNRYIGKVKMLVVGDGK